MQVACPLTKPTVNLFIIYKVLGGIALGTFIIAMIIAPKIIKLLKRLNITQPGKEELEKIITNARLTRGRPIMGGLIILITVFIYALITLIFGTYQPADIWILVALFTGGVLGFINDLADLKGKLQRLRIHDRYNPLVHGNFARWMIWHYLATPIRLFKRFSLFFSSYTSGLSAGSRLFWEFTLIGIGVILINKFHPVTNIWIFGLTTLQVPLTLAILIYGILGIAFINAFNITDGVDGISASNHIISFTGMILLALALKEYTFARYLAAIIGAEIAFLYFNIPPAKIEMSDVGTVPLGMLFFLSFVYLNRVLISPFFGIWYVIIVASSTFQVIWVLLFKKRLFAIAPFHHLLEKHGIERPSIVMYSNIVTLIGVILGLMLA